MEFLKYLAFFILVMIVNGDEDDEVAPGCEDKVMDVYFLLDASSSIWIEHFKELPPFVRNVVSELDIGASKTRVGVSSFSTSMQPAPIRLSRFSDKETLRNYITINNIPYLTGITITSRAIREVRESRDFREDAIKVIVVATDGVSTSRQRSASESDAARKQGFYLFVLGFGIEPNDLEWKDIANDPDQDFIHLVNGIGNDTLYINGSFIEAKDWLISKICALPPPSTGLGLPEDLCNVDGVYASLYFLSGSGTALNFIYDISRDFVRGTRGNPIDVEVGYRLPTCTNAGLPLPQVSGAKIMNNEYSLV
ncbi:Collagen alpha-4(VI) chain [Bulinus truncatus]|nr:Collagen alpha-4(VI) chain [Bulinus truncatus]